MPRVASPSPRRGPARSRRGRSPGRGDSKKRSESPMFGQPTPSARGGRSRLSVVQNRTPSRPASEVERLQFNSPGPKMSGLDSPTPRAARSRSRGRGAAPPTPAAIMEEAPSPSRRSSLSPARASRRSSSGSNGNGACASSTERVAAKSRSPLRRVPSPQRDAAAAQGVTTEEAPACNYL